MLDLTLEIKEGRTGLIYATSPNPRGLLVAGRSLAEVLAKIPAALEELEEAMRSVASSTP